LLIAIPGLFRLARRHPGLAVLAGFTPIAYLLFYARYTQWEGGYCFGPRYLVPVMPLLALGLGPVLSECRPGIRRLAIGLFVFGLLVQAVGMSTSFLEDQAGGRYYDQHWNYQMGYSPLGSQSELLVHYITTVAPAPIGRGFDRWFVFLGKAGVSHAMIAGMLLLECLGTVWAGALLVAALHKSYIEAGPSP
jgi:hypothetical protein